MNRAGWLKGIVFVLLLLCISHIAVNMPVQELKITAVTQAEQKDLLDTADLWYVKSLDAGISYTAIIKFMAVEDTSGRLFVSHGHGQYVYLGCDEMTGRCGFISLGRFLHVRLTLQADQTELKLEDGTPFDITRYSLRPVLIIEEQPETNRGT